MSDPIKDGVFLSSGRSARRLGRIRPGLADGAEQGAGRGTR